MNSNQSEYDHELASTISVQDVYTVKGYNSDFRIMTYQEDMNGQIWAEFFECLNGITVSNGGDLFDKLKIVGNVDSATWESYDSWYNGKNQIQELANDETLQQFIQSMYDGKPIDWDKLYKQGLYNEGTRKYVDLTLKDKSQIRLELHEEGYVRYSNSRVFFKLDDKTFSELWEKLK